MLTIKAEIKKQEQKLDGTYNVKLRFTLDRKVKRLSTSLFVTSKDLSKDLRTKQSSPFRQEVDNLIRSYQERCAKLQIGLINYLNTSLNIVKWKIHHCGTALDYMHISICRHITI